MAERTTIEWAAHTWSPWEGCTKVSPACDHCYAAARNARFSRGANWGPGVPRRFTLDWDKPRRWNAAAAKAGTRPRVFPSICDPFDNEVPGEWRSRFFELCNSTPYLTWLLLTKRISNVQAMVGQGPFATLPNVWLGATICNQEEADRDIPKLLAVPARVRFLSVEPMLGSIALPRRSLGWKCCVAGVHVSADMACGDCDPCIGAMGEPFLRWVICGGESGPHARPMHPDWPRALRDQCAAAGVPFFFKQWGEHVPADSDAVDPGIHGSRLRWSDGSPWMRDDGQRGVVHLMARVGKAAAGRMLDGVEHNGFPEAA